MEVFSHLYNFSHFKMIISRVSLRVSGPLVVYVPLMVYLHILAISELSLRPGHNILVQIHDIGIGFHDKPHFLRKKPRSKGSHVIASQNDGIEIPQKWELGQMISKQQKIT